MKTTCFIFFFFLVHSMLPGQTSPHTQGTCTLTHENGTLVAMHSDTLHHQCSFIEIMNLPPVSACVMPIHLGISAKGTYMLKKSPSLMIPGDYTVMVQDMLTGQHYNLRSPEPFTFCLSDGSSESRFMLEISKNSPR